MGAGIADFIIEQGADWAVQLYWVTEQNSAAIAAQGPMDMDIVSPVTGQRLIRLDDGANGGIDTGGAPFGILQLGIDRDTTAQFAPGNYIYDLFAYSVGPPLQRVRLLTGSTIVQAKVTDLGVQFGQIVNAGVLPPDIVLNVALTTGPDKLTFSFDSGEPSNQGDNPETGKPMRARLRGPTGNLPTDATVVFQNDQGQTGPVVDAGNDPIQPQTVQGWLATDAVITITYNNQTNGLTVSKAETDVFA
jgi:hypothetical protein